MKLLPVNNISTNNKKHISPVKITGYSAILTGVGCIVQAKRHKYKSHKFLAILASILTLTHIGIIEYHNAKNYLKNQHKS